MADNNKSILGGQNGFNCPVCHRFIPVSVKELFQNDAVVCPNCGLCLTIDRKQSETAMQMLEHVINEQKRIDNR